MEDERRGKEDMSKELEKVILLEKVSWRIFLLS
jgi:hypothetical protein